jgi:hypothetical protein
MYVANLAFYNEGIGGPNRLLQQGYNRRPHIHGSISGTMRSMLDLLRIKRTHVR